MSRRPIVVRPAEQRGDVRLWAAAVAAVAVRLAQEARQSARDVVDSDRKAAA